MSVIPWLNPTGWPDLFYSIDPLAWGYGGVALALGTSIAGAAWYNNFYNKKKKKLIKENNLS